MNQHLSRLSIWRLGMNGTAAQNAFCFIQGCGKCETDQRDIRIAHQEGDSPFFKFFYGFEEGIVGLQVKPVTCVRYKGGFLFWGIRRIKIGEVPFYWFGEDL